MTRERETEASNRRVLEREVTTLKDRLNEMEARANVRRVIYILNWKIDIILPPRRTRIFAAFATKIEKLAIVSKCGSTKHEGFDRTFISLHVLYFILMYLEEVYINDGWSWTHGVNALMLNQPSGEYIEVVGFVVLRG